MLLNFSTWWSLENNRQKKQINFWLVLFLKLLSSSCWDSNLDLLFGGADNFSIHHLLNDDDLFLGGGGGRSLGGGGRGGGVLAAKETNKRLDCWVDAHFTYADQLIINYWYRLILYNCLYFHLQTSYSFLFYVCLYADDTLLFLSLTWQVFKVSK